MFLQRGYIFSMVFIVLGITGCRASIGISTSSTCAYTDRRQNTYFDNVGTLDIKTGVTFEQCEELCCKYVTCKGVTWLAKPFDKFDIKHCNTTENSCCLLKVGEGTPITDPNSTSSLKLNPKSFAIVGDNDSFFHDCFMAAVYFGFLMTPAGMAWLITLANSRGYLLPCVQFIPIWKFLTVVYNRKGVVLIFWTFFTILTATVEQVCDYDTPFVYKLRSWKTFYPNGSSIATLGFQYFKFGDFPIRINQTTEWWGSLAVDRDVQNGNITTVLDHKCNVNHISLLVVTWETLIAVPFIFLATFTASLVTHWSPSCGSFAQQVCFELELENLFFKYVITGYAGLALVATLLLFVVLQKTDNVDVGQTMAFITNVAQFFIGCVPYMLYDGPLEYHLLGTYYMKRRRYVPNIPEISPSYNVTKTWIAMTKTSDVFFQDLTAALGESRYSIIRDEIQAVKGVVPHTTLPEAVITQVKLILVDYSLTHVSHEWFTWYTLEEQQEIREFMYPVTKRNPEINEETKKLHDRFLGNLFTYLAPERLMSTPTADGESIEVTLVEQQQHE